VLCCEIIKGDGSKLIIHTVDVTPIIQAFLCCN
jgi:hypothetical protein